MYYYYCYYYFLFIKRIKWNEAPTTMSMYERQQQMHLLQQSGGIAPITDSTYESMAYDAQGPRMNDKGDDDNDDDSSSTSSSDSEGDHDHENETSKQHHYGSKYSDKKSSGGTGTSTAIDNAAGWSQFHSDGNVQNNNTDQNPELANNKCDLLWQGLLPRRIFTGFKFQECAGPSAARKLLKSKGVGHYWDMIENADAILKSSEDVW
jgi:hypothetical protein